MFWKKKEKRAEEPQNKKLVSIDGDLFQLELPTDSFWCGLRDFCAKVSLPVGGLSNASPFLLQSGVSAQYLYASDMTANHPDGRAASPIGELVYNKGLWNVIGYREKLWAFQPNLIPLFQDGGFAIESNFENNPNGTITTGGTLYINGKPVLLADSIYRFDPEKMNVWIGDTVPGYELRWINWRGCMFAENPLVYTSVRDVLFLTGNPGERI